MNTKITRICTVLSFALPVLVHVAQAEDLRQLYEQIHDANRLDAKGQTPFHIKVAAQLYDLSGKPAGTGTAEEWWAAGHYRIEIEGPDGKEIQTSNMTASEVKPSRAQRSNYLLHVLLDQNVNPLADLPENAKVVRADREFDQTKYRCLYLDADEQTYCVPFAGTELRISTKNGTYVGLRNQIAHFHDTSVALKTASLYGNTPAISGEVKLLQSFDPASSSFPEFQADGTALNEPESSPSGPPSGVTAGHLLSSQRPEYPEIAKLGHTKGIVDILAVISREGRVGSVDVLASPSTVLSNAALDAVRKWTFTPYLLNGKPTEVTEVLQVRFR